MSFSEYFKIDRVGISTPLRQLFQKYSQIHCFYNIILLMLSTVTEKSMITMVYGIIDKPITMRFSKTRRKIKKERIKADHVRTSSPSLPTKATVDADITDKHTSELEHQKSL